MISLQDSTQTGAAGQFKELLGEGTLLIVGEKVNGLGDLSCAAKIARLFSDRVKVPEEQIAFMTNEPVVLKELFTTGRNYKIIYSKDPEALKGVENIRFAIVAPYDRGWSGAAVACKTFPVLFLDEYNFEKQGIPVGLERSCEEYPLGLKSGVTKAIGILIDQELKEWSRSQAAEDPLERAQQLSALPKQLKELILGKESPSEFARKTALFVGYASKEISKKNFLGAITTVERDSEKDLVLVLPGPSLSWQNRPAKIEKELLACLIENNIGQIRTFVHKNNEVTEQTPISIADKGKTLKIVTGDIPLQIFWRACERDVLASGDQSVGEAISANKAVIYERLDHKQSLFHFLTYTLSIPAIPYREVSREAIQDVVASIQAKRGENYQSTNEKNRLAQDGHDASESIVSIAAKLLERNPVVPPPIDLRAIEEDAFNPASLPFDAPVMINIDQLSMMRLRNGHSERPELRDSVFSTTLTTDGYLIVRRKA